jgi:hypothetical protein
MVENDTDFTYTEAIGISVMPLKDWSDILTSWLQTTAIIGGIFFALNQYEQSQEKKPNR